MSDATSVSTTTDTDTSVTAINETTAASTYTAAELEDASRRFNVPKECITAALKEQKKTAFTMDEADAIVKNFLIREVKR